jgi:hypothetical protein
MGLIPQFKSKEVSVGKTQHPFGQRGHSHFAPAAEICAFQISCNCAKMRK